MTRFFQYLLYGCTLLILWSSSRCNSTATGTSDSVPFKPVYLVSGGGTRTEIEYPDEGFKDRLIFVLEHYGTSYEVKEGKVWVERSFYEQKDMPLNYTLKAQDTTWLRQRNYSDLQ